ncbi:hypothetical protein HYH02_000847 [Chlamydomonas schloesseri]|uniref:Cyclic nucleotide-binding domain-containing protein n=1 Tax=Chlamydomonas schloesseri TaxID=2026947 RepID=A0A835WVX9_9CHLO|nr:hypothetical protein HYH02_000847 [Chlamydomonas schloesseri]|eukprot:KAG2455022.1 hypothetical protein HYH02_000847 [Chlamydomonas schloesseri]
MGSLERHNVHSLESHLGAIGDGQGGNDDRQTDGRPWHEAPFAHAFEAGHVDAALNKFSLKLEDMAANAARARGSAPRRNPFRRIQHQKKQKQLQKSYSQYNLSHLDSSAGEGSSSKKRKHLGGVYGLLARHIDVPQHLMEKAQELAEGRSPHFFSRRSLLGLPMLHPYSRWSVAWRAAMLLFDLTFTAFWVPLNIGFCYGNYGNLDAPCTQSDLAGGIVYVSNWLMGFLMGAVLSHGSKRTVCVDGRIVTYAYVAYGKFVMDLLASIPFFVLVGTIASGGGGGETRLLSLLSLLRLVRMMRLVNTVKVVYQDSLSGHYRMSFITRTVSVSAMYLLLLAFQFAVVVNMCASLMIMLAAFYGYDNTWYDSLGWWSGMWDTLHPAHLWYNAVYWVITALTTTGAGQAPRQVGEQVVSNFCSVYGMVFNGLVVGVVGRALMQATGDASNLYLSRKKVGLVSNWADTRHLPPSVKKELQVYFADSELAREEFGFEAGVIEGLPTTLRRQVVAYIVRPLVDKVHILSSAEPELRDLIATMFRPLDVPPGHDLCRQGHLADRLWLVEWGTVEALRHKEKEAHPTTGMACLLGEGVLLRGLMDVAAVRPWTLRTSSACRLWELAWEDLEPLLRVYPRLQGIALQYIKDRVIRALDGIPQHDTAWCEVAAVLSRILKQPAMLDQARDNLEALQHSGEEDGSLPALLGSWLEAGISTTLELGATGAQKRGLVTMSIMLACQSRDALAAPSTALSGPYPPYASHPLGAPSLALLPRYGGGSAFRRGGTGASGLAAQSVGLGTMLPGGTTAAALIREPSGGAPGVNGLGVGMGGGGAGGVWGALSVQLPLQAGAGDGAEGQEQEQAQAQAQGPWQARAEAAAAAGSGPDSAARPTLASSTVAARGHGSARRSRSFTSRGAHDSGTPPPPSPGSQPPPGGLPSSPMQIALSSSLLQPSRPPATPSRLAISSRHHHSHSHLGGGDSRGADAEAAQADAVPAAAAAAAVDSASRPADAYARSPLGARPPPRRSFSDDGAAEAARARVAAAATATATATAGDAADQARGHSPLPTAPQPQRSPQLPSQQPPFQSNPDAVGLDSVSSVSGRTGTGPPSWVANPMAEEDRLPLVEDDPDALALATVTPEGLGLAANAAEVADAAAALAEVSQRPRSGLELVSPLASTAGLERVASMALDSPQRSDHGEWLSVIAHTSRAFDIVDAGGTPLGAAAASAVSRHARLSVAAGMPRAGSWQRPKSPTAAAMRRTVTEVPATSPRRRQQQAPPSWHPAAAAAGASDGGGGSFTAGVPQALARGASGGRAFRSFTVAAGLPAAGAAGGDGGANTDGESSRLLDRLRVARLRANSLSRRRVHSADFDPGYLLGDADTAAGPSRELNRATADGTGGILIGGGAGSAGGGGGEDDDGVGGGAAAAHYRLGTGASSVSGVMESAAGGAAAGGMMATLRPGGLGPSAFDPSARMATAPLPGRVSALLARHGTPPRAPSSSGVSGGSAGLAGGGGGYGRSGSGLASPRSRLQAPADGSASSGVAASVAAAGKEAGGAAAPVAGASAATASAAADAGGGCMGPAQCPTCGKCTCAECRSRAAAAAQALEAGAAAVVNVPMAPAPAPSHGASGLLLAGGSSRGPAPASRGGIWGPAGGRLGSSNIARPSLDLAPSARAWAAANANASGTGNSTATGLAPTAAAAATGTGTGTGASNGTGMTSAGKGPSSSGAGHVAATAAAAAQFAAFAAEGPGPAMGVLPPAMAYASRRGGRGLGADAAPWSQGPSGFLISTSGTVGASGGGGGGGGATGSGGVDSRRASRGTDTWRGHAPGQGAMDLVAPSVPLAPYF